MLRQLFLKISAKKLERKKERAEKRNKHKGNKGSTLANAAGLYDIIEEELPDEMRYPGGERRDRVRRYLAM